MAEALSRPNRPVYPGPAFASEYLPNARQVTALNKISNLQGSLVLCFDYVLQNIDRTIHNPNCLYEDKNVTLIDHEASLDFVVSRRNSDLNFHESTVMQDHVFRKHLGAFLAQSGDLTEVFSTVVSADQTAFLRAQEQVAAIFDVDFDWKRVASRIRILKQNVGKSVRELTFLAV